ncbi:hypothetical protein G6F40_015676 [Rhizopus arrhizus]|nr:hypothetical protein G6F40_015676 [Rhizopus arrhizus]
MSIAQDHTALRQLDKDPGRRGKLRTILSFSLGAAGVAGMWKLPWLDIATAGVIGLMIGLLGMVTDRRPATREAAAALAALLAGLVATLVASFVGALNLNTVIIASLVVLLPGMSLTNAVNELASQHWVSGTARFAGALTTIMKLSVGAMIAVTLADVLGLDPVIRAAQPQGPGVEPTAAITRG